MRCTNIDASSGAIQEYINGNPWHKGTTLPVALIGSSLAAVKWQHNGIHLRVYYQAADHTLKEHAWDGSWYVGMHLCYYSNIGGFHPGRAPKFTPITAIGWLEGSGIKLRVYWEDIYRDLIESGWNSGWSHPARVHLPHRIIGVYISAIQWNSGKSIRIYDQGDKDEIVEQATDNSSSSWYNGQGVATSNLKPRPP